MMEEISIIQAILNGGPALLLAIGVAVLWRTWRADAKKKDEDLAAAQESLADSQEKRVEDAQCWSKKYNELGARMQLSLENFDKYMSAVDRLTARGGHDA